MSDGEVVAGHEGLFWDINTIGGSSSTLSAVAAGDGYVAGKVKVSGTGVGVQNDLAVYYVAPGQEPQLALREGDPIPGVTESALLQELNEILLDDSGTLYIRGYVQVPGESELLYFVIKGTPDAWELLAITGQSYGADRKMTGIGVIAINHSGDLIMFGTTELVEPVNNSRMNFGHIWKERPEPGENEILATEKVGYGFLGSGEVFKGFDEIAINDLGTIFVSCSINFEKAFVVGSGNNFSVIARQNSPAPDGNIYDNVPLSGNFSYFPGDKDAFGIKAWVDIEDPDRKQFNERLFVYQNGGTTVSHTYEEGKSYTGIGGEMIDSVQSISVYSDRHFLRGITEGKTGYWLVDSQVQKIAAVGDSPAYSPDGVFSAVGGPFIGRTGQIAYQATAASFPGVYVQGVDGEFAMAAGRNVEVRLKNDQIRALVRGYTMGNSSAMDGRFPIVVWALGSITHIAMVDPNQLGQPSPGISGKVFEDADYSGDLSEDDRGLPNVEVELFLDDGTGGEAIRSQFTLTDGSYAFDELQDGNYLVRITPMEDYTPTWDTTDPLDDGLISVAYTAETLNIENDFLVQKELTYEVGLSLHQVDPAIPDSVTNSDVGLTDIDAPLEVTDDPDLLYDLPIVGFGLVADGVTPLLVKVTGPTEEPLPVARTLKLLVSTDGGTIGTLGEGVESKIEVLRPSESGLEWESGSLELVLPKDEDSTEFNEAEAWFQIRPIAFDELKIDPGFHEVTGTIELLDEDSDEVVETIVIPIRRPPIMLVHGFNSAESWGDDFLGELESIRPGFVVPISYGTDPVFDNYRDTIRGIVDDSARNSFSPGPEHAVHDVFTLAPALQKRIDQAYGENGQLGRLRRNWAFTRPDVLGHSQGGVLVRMLSSKPRENPMSKSARVVRPFRSEENFNRGRFHRIVTLGAPHLGSTFIYYVRRFFENKTVIGYNSGDVSAALFGFQGGIVQDKWDPKGEDMRNLNRPDGDWQPDPDAKFHLVSTTILDGKRPPAERNFLTVGTFLEDQAEWVIPNGFDGVVDVESQEGRKQEAGRSPNVSSRPSNESISHSSFPRFFGRFDEIDGKVIDPKVQTEFKTLATYIAGLFETGRGFDESGFDEFPPLSPYESGDLSDLDKFIDELPADVLGRIEVFKSEFEAKIDRSLFIGLKQNDGSDSYELELVISPEDPVPSNAGITWLAQRFDQNGSETLIEELEVDATDTSKAVLRVPAEGTGDYWVQTYYFSEEGKFVYSPSQLVVSIPPEGTSPVELVLLPSRANLVVGENRTPRLFVRYSDGSLFEKALEGAEFVSSDVEVLDVSAGTVWEALQEGISEVTVSLNEMQTTVSVIVQYAAQASSIAWEEWRSAFFEEADLANLEISGPDADPDRDEASNLVEYVRTSDPNRRDDFNTVFVDTIRNGDLFFAQVIFPLRDVLENISVKIQRSNELGEWEDVITATEPGALESPMIVDADYGPAVSVFTLRDEVSLSGADDKRFYRMVAEVVEP